MENPIKMDDLGVAKIPLFLVQHPDVGVGGLMLELMGFHLPALNLPRLSPMKLPFLFSPRFFRDVLPSCKLT